MHGRAWLLALGLGCVCTVLQRVIGTCVGLREVTRSRRAGLFLFPFCVRCLEARVTRGRAMASAPGCLASRARVVPAGAGPPGQPRLARLRLPKKRWVWAPAPGDDSDCVGCESLPEAPPRHVVVPRACAPPERRREATPSEGAAEEIAVLLRGLAASAEAGATPRERMLAVCRIAIAHVATWLKPATKIPAGGPDQVGAASSIASRYLRKQHAPSSLTPSVCPRRSELGRASHPARGPAGRRGGVAGDAARRRRAGGAAAVPGAGRAALRVRGGPVHARQPAHHRIHANPHQGTVNRALIMRCFAICFAMQPPCAHPAPAPAAHRGAGRRHATGNDGRRARARARHSGGARAGRGAQSAG